MSRNLVSSSNGQKHQQQQQSETGGGGGGGGGGSGGNNRSAPSLNDIWEDLCVGIESTYQQQTMPKARYMILYS